jgi:hypothetical protein
VAARLDVRPVGALSGGQLAGVRAIYEGGFGPDLRVPFGELTLTGDADLTFVAMDGQVPAGVAALRRLGSARWSFLRYFAIAGDRRGQGLGRQFWPLLHLSLCAHAWPACVVFEVEDPGEAGCDPAERVTRERRISFWTGCGARPLPVPGYVLPDYTGCGTTEPMLLMAFAPAAGPPVHGDRLRRLVLAIYTDRYGLAPDGPLVSRALASIPVGDH